MKSALREVSTEPLTTVDGGGREPRRGGSAPWLAVLLIAALAITLAGVFPFRQIIAQDRQVENTRSQLDTLIAENAALEEEVDALQTEAEVERIAREELGLVRPGEVGYNVENDGGPSEAVEPVDTIDADDRSFIDKIWDFLTGRDLEPAE